MVESNPELFIRADSGAAGPTRPVFLDGSFLSGLRPAFECSGVVSWFSFKRAPPAGCNLLADFTVFYLLTFLHEQGIAALFLTPVQGEWLLQTRAGLHPAAPAWPVARPNQDARGDCRAVTG